MLHSRVDGVCLCKYTLTYYALRYDLNVPEVAGDTSMSTLPSTTCVRNSSEKYNTHQEEPPIEVIVERNGIPISCYFSTYFLRH
eukprot:1492069-Amphidinium_carterae.3